MPQKVVIPTSNSEFDGYIDVVFQDRDTNVVKEVPHIDALAEREEIFESLADDQKSGTALGNAIRDHILAKYGVRVNVFAAYTYWEKLEELLKNAENFFTSPPDSPDSTDLTLAPSAESKFPSGIESQNESEPENKSNN